MTGHAQECCPLFLLPGPSAFFTFPFNSVLFPLYISSTFTTVKGKTLKEVLAHMDARLPFSLMFITANKQPDIGGEELDIPTAWNTDSKIWRE